MMRAAVIAFLLSLGVSATTLAQTRAPSATPTGGDVGSASLRNGFPAGGGAVALPSIATSSTLIQTPAAGTTSPTTTFSTSPTASATTISGSAGGAANTSSGTASGAGGGFSAGGGGSGGGSASSGTATAARGNGSSSSAGTATATGPSGNGNWVLCPPSGASGLAPLFTGTDLSCAPD